MSIVEKALSKLHAAKPRGSETAPRDIGAPAHAAPTAPAAEPAPIRSRARIAPRERIQVDAESLRRQRVLPPVESLDRIADEFRRIKWPLLGAAFGKGTAPVPRGNLILVTSSVADEGKSFTSINLALSIAVERDCRVLLIDTDNIKARVTNVFGLQNRPGLIDCLKDGTSKLGDMVVETDIEGLAVLPAGRQDSAAPELFASRRMEYLLTELAEQDPSEILLLDCSPLLAKNEPQVLSRIVGQVLMVVRADYTPRPLVLDALALLDRNKPIHLVLNQTNADLLAKYYGYHQYESYEGRNG
jgi:exopolysaccharide/PEP-CTERM locus tyrosine autokinase